jgi:2-oxoisovalerate dehydrogenase E1 component alpha subunit
MKKNILKVNKFKKFYSNELSFKGIKKSLFTNDLKFENGDDKTFPVYRIMDVEGNIENKKDFEKLKKLGLSDEKIIFMYKKMLKLNTMDDILFNAQRQGRISFYMTNYGEEAAQIGSIAGIFYFFLKLFF